MRGISKKILTLITAVLVLIVSTNIFAVERVNLSITYDGKTMEYNEDAINIVLDGKPLTNFEMPPVSIEGRTMLPARALFEAAMAEVIWDDAKNEVKIVYGSDVVLLEIDSENGNINGSIFTMDVPVKIINGRTMIPTRAVAEELGFTVGWEDSTRTVTVNTSKESTVTTPQVSDSDKISLVWDQITTSAHNDGDGKRDIIDGLDVMSPTWFKIENNEGDISDEGSFEYVKWCHDNGYKVWALFSNDFNKERTHITLSSPEIRRKMIDEICNKVTKYNLDGINIDFESLGSEDGGYFLEFIREITPRLKELDVTVSVDMFIPKPWTSHYNMEEVGKVVDYVMLMAYDEHWSTSPKSGSVASLGWVEVAIQDTLEMVPKEKLLLGVPFYTRRWAETPVEGTDGEVKVTSVSMKMQEAYDLLIEEGAIIKWDETTKQYYGEYEKDGVIRKIWLEDERSMEERMKLVEKYDLAGVAAWKRGHEKEEVWEVINAYLGK